MRIIILFLFITLNIFANNKNFKVAYDSNFTPFSYKDKDKETGLIIDLLKTWAKYNNYNIKFVENLTWSEKINSLREGNIDFFIGNNNLEHLLKQSFNIFESKATLFSLSKNMNSINPNSKIGLIEGSNQEDLKIKFPNSEIVYFEKISEMINALKHEDIEFFYADKTAIEFYIANNNLYNLIKTNENIYTNINGFKLISNNQNNINIFEDGFSKIPIFELLQSEKQWLYNNKEFFYENFKNKISLNEAEKQFIKNLNMKISISSAWFPFSFKSEKNEPAGISSLYWDLIKNNLDLKTQNIFFDNFNDQISSLKNRDTDLIFSAGETEDRKEYALFSKEYAKFPISIATKKDENFIEHISQIKDKKIAIGNNFTAHRILKKEFPNIEFILVKNPKEGLKLVSDNLAFAYVDIKPVLFYNIAKYDLKDLKVTGNSGFEYALKIMFRDDYKELESILNKAISSISLNELNEIIEKWQNVQFQTTVNYKFLWITLSIFSLLTLAFLYRYLTIKELNNKLKSIVDEKTKKLNDINRNLENIIEEKTKELIKKENILNQQTKMAAMGEMIENIAHQWRQPLSVISTLATSIKLKKELNSLDDIEFIKDMELINQSAQHLSTTIDDFRNFFNQEKQENSFDISETIDKTLHLLSSRINNHNISIILNIEKIEINSFESELIQVLLNILNNAIDAFKEKNIDKKFVFIELIHDENYIYLTIKDNAGGIKEDIINRIFEPYFTTKHKSQGTGIGLYMSLEIVKKHMNGDIFVSNKKYIYNNLKCEGAEFKIIIPIKNNVFNF